MGFALIGIRMLESGASAEWCTRQPTLRRKMRAHVRDLGAEVSAASDCESDAL